MSQFSYTNMMNMKPPRSCNSTVYLSNDINHFPFIIYANARFSLSFSFFFCQVVRNYKRILKYRTRSNCCVSFALIFTTDINWHNSMCVYFFAALIFCNSDTLTNLLLMSTFHVPRKIPDLFQQLHHEYTCPYMHTFDGVHPKYTLEAVWVNNTIEYVGPLRARCTVHINTHTCIPV